MAERKKPPAGDVTQNPPGAKPRKRPRRKSPSPEELERFASTNETIIHLAFEAVEGRVRHRALLDTLRSGAPFDWSRYLENFRIVAERDRLAILDSLLLTESAFNTEYADWLKADLEKYGFPTRPHPRASASADEPITSDDG